MPPTPDPGPGEFRWQAFFQHATAPLFLLNRRRRVLFVNRAWEACTGLRGPDVRGRACRPRAAPADDVDAVLAALAPPPEALHGEAARVRRRPTGAGPGWWEVSFFPLPGPDGLLGLLGQVHVLAPAGEAAFTLPERLMALRDRQARHYRLDDLRGETPAVRRVREQARLAVTTRLPLTVVGEAGVGKHWLARTIHQAGPARQQYFARLDCARLPPPLLAELLFGPRARLLSLGTLYLREPEQLPREVQARLAELLDPPAASLPRVVLAYRVPPDELVRAGRLLDELHCRGSPLTITLPPLRDRRDELPGFIETLLPQVSQAAGVEVRGVRPEALAVLSQYAWPGNLQELAAVLRGACRRAKGEQLDAADLPLYLKQGPLPAERQLPLDALLEQAERRLIQLALRLSRNNKSRTAELLAIWRPRLLRRMEQLGLAEAAPGDAPAAGPEGG